MRRSILVTTASVFDALRSFSIRSVVGAKQNKALLDDIVTHNRSNFISTQCVF